MLKGGKYGARNAAEHGTGNCTASPTGDKRTPKCRKVSRHFSFAFIIGAQKGLLLFLLRSELITILICR